MEVNAGFIDDRIIIRSQAWRQGYKSGSLKKTLMSVAQKLIWPGQRKKSPVLSNPYIHSMFKNFTAIASMQLLFIPFGCFYTASPSKTWCQDAEAQLLLRGKYSADAKMQ